MSNHPQISIQRLKPEQRTVYANLSTEEQNDVLQSVASEWYEVYKPEIDSVAHDPLDPAKRYHDGIFILLHPVKGTGTLFEVTGDVIAADGMEYQEKTDHDPGESGLLHRKTSLGLIRKADYESGILSSTLRNIPTPTRQQGLNFWERDPVTKRHELIWVRQDGERYEPGEARRPVFKCNEWTNEAVDVLRRAGILHIQ